MSSDDEGTPVMGAHQRTHLERKQKRLERQAAKLARRLHEEPQSEQEREIISLVRMWCRKAADRESFGPDDVTDHLERVTDTLRANLPTNFTVVEKFDFSHTRLCEVLLTGEVYLDAAFISLQPKLYKADNVYARVVERDCGMCLVCVERWQPITTESDL